MMLSVRELARIFFAGESDEARIVTADVFDKCEHLGAASIAIGVFDGVHRGHQELIAALVRDARAHGCKAVVVTFDPDPDVVVSPSPAQKLMTTADRLHALAQTGVDAVVAVPFTPEVAALDHVDFLSLVSRLVDIRSIRVGSDFRLGRGGASGVAGGSLLLIPMACSLFGIPNDVAMQVVGIGFIIGVIQDSVETALNSSSDLLLSASAEFRQWRKEGMEITY